LLKLLINIFIIYSIWQIIRMFFSVKKVQENFQQQVDDLNQRVRKQQETAPKKDSKKPGLDEEYIDYEEIK
jgi:hypothetical protein